ncbi:MAG TPA: hypothetical protein DIS92_05445 [Alistipes sp.]|nr:hypothetical protein [Alistipes sp.]
MPEFRHVPHRAAPAPAAQQRAEEEPEEEQPDEPRYTAPEPKRKRDWGSIFQKTFDRINQTFSAAEDEEI